MKKIFWKIIYYLVIGIIGIIVLAIYVLHRMYMYSEHDLFEINWDTLFTRDNFVFSLIITFLFFAIAYFISRNR
jgi:hypothetical protein